MSIERRIQKAEERLNVVEKPLIIINRVHFGDGPLPPEPRHDNIVVRHVSFDSIEKRPDGKDSQ